MTFEFDSENWKLSIDNANCPHLLHKQGKTAWKSGFPWLGIACHGASLNLLHCEYVNNAKCTINECDGNSARLVICWEKFGIEIKLDIFDDRDTVRFVVPENGITEKNHDLYRLAWIDLLPGLGARSRGDSGYVFIPSSQGVIHYFDETRRKLPVPDLTGAHSEFSYRSPWGRGGNEFHCRRKIYGSFQRDHAWEAQVPLPYIGTVCGKSALMQMIDAGECFSEYHFAADAGPEQLIWVDFRLGYRENFFSAVDFSRREMSYHCLTGSDASWQGMAGRYRHNLVENRKVATLEERAQKSNELAFFLRHSQIRTLMGFRKPTGDGNGEMAVRMTYKDLAESVQRLHQAGIDKCQLTCVGFNRDGHDGCYPTIFPFCDAFGQEAELEQTMTGIKASGWKFSFHLQYWDSFRKSPDFSMDNVIIQADGSPLNGGLWAGGLSYILCPAAAAFFMKRDLPKVKDYGFEGVVYLDASLCKIEECCNPSHALSRKGFLEQFNQNLAYTSSLFGGVQNEFGLAGTLGYIDNILYAPRDERHCLTQLRESRLFGCGYVHEFVPAWDMVSHGLTAYNVYSVDYSDADSWNTFILDSARRGALPEMRFENGCPSELEVKNMKQTYDLIKSFFADIQFEAFRDYSEITSGVYESVFESKRVISNYLEKPVEIQGEIIPARSFKCLSV